MIAGCWRVQHPVLHCGQPDVRAKLVIVLFALMKMAEEALESLALSTIHFNLTANLQTFY